MIYKSLEGKAQKQANPFFESGGIGGTEKPEDFISFLDRGNWDQTRVSRARSELHGMKMGPKQRWSTFYPQWATKLTEALGDNWPDETKVSLLKSTLNQTLRVALAGNHLVPENDFFEFCRIVSKIAHQYEEIHRTISAHHPDYRNSRAQNPNYEDSRLTSDYSEQENVQYSRSGKEYRPIGSEDSGGDVFMGGVNTADVLRGPSGKPIRAKWKSPEKIDSLRKQGLCFRCERKGCHTNICKLLPAVKPKPKLKAPRINHVTLNELDPSLYEEFEETEN